MSDLGHLGMWENSHDVDNVLITGQYILITMKSQTVGAAQ